ncbi:hypothetical protein C8Q75DRAFT_106513 [Abortiporus biennis]|nr:hypothetical protein C8Q75DRAFT_106513 [Abortiporus biennis]
MCVTLPLDVEERIIDFAWNDRSVLNSLSLTCKAFLPRCRYQLYHVIVVTYVIHQRFLDLLALNPELEFYVRDLRIRDFDLAIREFSPHETDWHTTTVPLLATKLHHVRKLELNSFIVGGLLRRAVQDNFKSVQEIRLTQCHFLYKEALFSLFSSFPQLKKWKMKNVRLGPLWPLDGQPHVPNNENDRPEHVPAQITTLRVLSRMEDGELMPSFINWILDKGVYDNLKVVELCDLRFEDLQSTRNVLTALGPKLNDFSLGFNHKLLTEIHDASTTPFLDLGQNTNLQVLTIRTQLRILNQFHQHNLSFHLSCFSGELPQDYQHSLTGILPLISSCSTSSLKDIHFRFIYYPKCLRDRHALNWNDLRSVLRSFNLTTVSFELCMFREFYMGRGLLRHVKRELVALRNTQVDVKYGIHRMM